MQNILLISTFFLNVIPSYSIGYGPPQQLQPVQSFPNTHFPHALYGAPPPAATHSNLQLDNPSYNPAHPPIPVLKAVVRTLEPIGKNYEVKLSQSSPEQTLEHHQFGYGGATYLSPPRSIPYTSHQNPLLTPHQSRATLPASLSSQPAQLFYSNNNQPYQPAVVADHFAQQSNQLRQIDNSLNGVAGNYISQSEANQLDHYFEKQNPVGEVRAYTRVVSTCYPDGHCDQQKLGSGQVDAKHQQVVQSARARVQPISDKCRNLQTRTNIINQNSVSGQGDKAYTDSIKINKFLKLDFDRPPNRRLYPYTETVILQDPFN
ncbi:uncharacterized protein [Eurosta solidaginis]|uniref:uncharacterized protein n=1 Tax=Eurosta solidaginis TaxID=178769 RepID=UPI00353159AB